LKRVAKNDSGSLSTPSFGGGDAPGNWHGRRRFSLPGRFPRRKTLSMPLSETIQFQATPELRRQIEEEAAKLNLSLSAYFLYLHRRAQSGEEAPRLERLVRDVFGTHGDLIRRLAK
jgi:hypothetical protein